MRGSRFERDASGFGEWLFVVRCPFPVARRCLFAQDGGDGRDNGLIDRGCAGSAGGIRLSGWLAFAQDDGFNRRVVALVEIGGVRDYTG